MPGAGDDDLAGRGVELDDDGRRHLAGQQRGDDLVEAVERDGRTGGAQQVGAQGVPQLGGDRGGGQPVPGDVPEHDRDPAAGQRHEVVPVAADDVLLAGQVPGRQRRTPATVGQLLEQQGALQRGDQPVVLVGAAQRGLGQVGGERAGGGDLVLPPGLRRLPRTVSLQPSNDCRGLSRGPAAVCAVFDVYGLPPQVTSRSVSGRNQARKSSRPPGDLDGEHAAGGVGEVGRLRARPGRRRR